MFRKINNRRTQTSTVLKSAAALALLSGFGITSTAMASPASVTSIQTQFTSGSPTEATNVPGGSSTYPGSSYTVQYDGGDLAITQVSAGGVNYLAQTTGTTTVVRNLNESAPDSEILSYQATGGLSGPTLELEGPPQTGFSQAFGGNNLLVGADNIFENTGDGNGDNTDVERIDTVNYAGITVGGNVAFTVFDRSALNNDPHDGFKIAAITSINSSGQATGFGPLETIANGSYGQDALLQNGEYVVVRKNLANGSSSPFEPAANHTDSTFGGVVIPTTDLASAGQTIYGYSLFALDVTGTGSELLNVDNTAVYPTNTTAAYGGLDPISIEGVTLVAVPEPASLGLLGGAALLTLGNRRRRALKA
jgi:hypothetical protein